MEFTNKLTAQVLGAILLVVGLLGFVMGDYVFGFQVNALHNWVHLLTGAALLGAVYYNKGRHVKQTNMTLGVVYLLVALAGFLGLAMVTETLAINMADNWLHLALGVVLVGAAYGAKK